MDQDIKRIKFFGEFLLALGGTKDIDRKIILTKLGTNKHLTLKVTEKFLDIHETEEGKSKKYTPLCTIKIEDLEKQFINKLGMVEDMFLKARINPKDTRYQEWIALIPKNEPNFFDAIATKKKKDIIIPAELLDNLEEAILKISIPVELSRVVEYTIERSIIVSNPEGEIYGLYQRGTDYFLLKGSDIMIFFENLFPSMKSLNN